jgi:hypothetical protein
MEIGMNHSIIKDRQVINDNISVLAYYLPQLKASNLKNDEQLLKRLLERYLSKETSIRSTVNHIENFEKDLKELKLNYGVVHDFISKNLPLENQVEITDKHEKYIENLMLLKKKQKELIYNIGQQFIDISKDLKKISKKSNKKI